ncbi:hypothetical protein C6N75_04545 [Streptomyces solincola]|uniref:Uncharacterized protein n=1 Tax=Streptomyces solincola TaxID=2100817 RepID=A0A2S9Q152_9ACTN|nr:hypothetical protein [Streptomyces solincola]PRH80362.1 hypothetical protein C6N75_04545 [Streptomyces solincola]
MRKPALRTAAVALATCGLLAFAATAQAVPGGPGGSTGGDTGGHSALADATVDWQPQTVPGGTVVYHTTDYQSAISILKNGIRPVASSWAGGGLAGAGFYTHRDWHASTNYFDPAKGAPVTLVFRTTREAHGKAVPQDVNAGNLAPDSYTPGNAFLSRAEDTDEIKWHSGDDLDQAGVEVRVYAGGGNDIDTADAARWTSYDAAGFRSYIEDDLMLDW